MLVLCRKAVMDKDKPGKYHRTFSDSMKGKICGRKYSYSTNPGL